MAVKRIDHPAHPEPNSQTTVFPELPTGYYLEHFRTLIATVEDRYGDLLISEERRFIDTFRALPLPEQRLYVRLASRKGPVFRTDRLSYPEISDLSGAWNSLAAAGLLTIDDPDLLEEAFLLLTAPELRDLAREEGISLNGAGLKSEISRTIRENLPKEVLLPALNRRFQWLSPQFLPVLRVFRLFFFGTPEPDLTAFVLTDLGKIRFERYPLLSSHRLFTTRDEVERALLLRDQRDELNEVLETASEESLEKEVKRLTALLPTSLTAVDGKPLAGPPAAGMPATVPHPTLTRWRRRFLEAAGRFWERRKRPELALELYSDPETLPARARRARLLARQGKTEESLSFCEEILAAPRDPEEEDVAIRLAGKIHGKKTDSSGFRPPVETLFLQSSSGERIERRVLETLSKGGKTGFEAENRFWTSLIGLVLWDIMYLPIPRAFGHPFQWGPADLFSAEFRPAREARIRERLASLTGNEHWREEILDLHRRKVGISNALVNWEAISFPMMEKVLQVLPSAHLAAVCDRLSRNPGGFKTGFPDLFLFTPEPPGYLLAEVKSPNDRLQNNQRSWMRYFAGQGIPCRVIQVEWNP